MNKLFKKFFASVFKKVHIPLIVISCGCILLWYLVSIKTANALSILININAHDYAGSFIIISRLISAVIAIGASCFSAYVFVKTSKTISQSVHFSGLIFVYIFVAILIDTFAENYDWINRDSHMIISYLYVLLLTIWIFTLYYRSAAYAKNQSILEDEYLFKSIYSHVVSANKLEDNLRNIENIFPSLENFINEQNLSDDLDTIKYCNELRNIPLPKLHTQYTSSEILNYSLIKYENSDRLPFDLSCDYEISEKEGFIIINLIDCIYETSIESETEIESIRLFANQSEHIYEFTINNNYSLFYRVFRHNQTIKIICNRYKITSRNNKKTGTITFTGKQKNTEA